MIQPNLPKDATEKDLTVSVQKRWLTSGSSLGSKSGDALQSRVRIYLLLVLASGLLIDFVIFFAQGIDQHFFSALTNPDALRRHVSLLAPGILGVLLSRKTLSRRSLLAVDAGAVVLLSISSLFGIMLRPAELRPELSAILVIVLVLVGRAAVVPSTAKRTLVIGAIALLPVLVIAPLFFPSDSLIAGISHRRLVRVSVLAFGAATLVVTALTSQFIFDLQRSMRKAMKFGPYEIGRVIGEGGMGTVYEARHALLMRRTALKLLKPTERDAAAEARFDREARVTSELSHPNTVALYDYGTTADGIEYYAMEFIDGITLRQLIHRDGALPSGRVVVLLRQVAASLAHAHRKGLIHRDIKPSNIMVCQRDGHPDLVKVLDFGLAKRMDASPELWKSSPDQRVGTPGYMAPEMSLAPNRVGPASDVYSVGVLGYYLLTGVLPFEGTGVASMVRAHLGGPPLLPSLLTPSRVPEDLERLLMRCLEKNPEHRFADGRALLDALEACENESWTQEDAELWWQTSEAPRGSIPPKENKSLEVTRKELSATPIDLVRRRTDTDVTPNVSTPPDSRPSRRHLPSPRSGTEIDRHRKEAWAARVMAKSRMTSDA